MYNLNIILSPLDQFEIRDLISINLGIINNSHISLTNIGFYLIISVIIILGINILATNYNKLISNTWSINQESLYATIYNIVINQINPKKGQIYFPFIYALFLFILINNLLGLVTRCLSLFIKIFIFNLNKNLFRLYSSYISISSSFPKYSFNNKNSYYIHPYYITGFIDGCFTISMFKDSRMFKG